MWRCSAKGKRALVEADRWAVEYRDASGRPRRKTGYTDRRATEALAAELQREVDRGNAGIIDQESVNLSEHLGPAIRTHTDAYRIHLQAAGVSDWHLSETMRRLGVLIDDCGFAKLADIGADPVQRWCELKSSEGMGARTRNTYTGSLRAFVRGCVADRRMASDPLATLAKADEATDKRRVRRALTEDELQRLLTIAELRPLAEYGRPVEPKPDAFRRGKRNTWRRGELTPDNLDECVARARANLKSKNATLLDRLVRAGRERALIYRTLILTGLRRGELAALTWGDLSLDTSSAWLTVRASIAKNRKEDSVPIRADLAAELRAWRTESGNPPHGLHLFRAEGAEPDARTRPRRRRDRPHGR